MSVRRVGVISQASPPSKCLVASTGNRGWSLYGATRGGQSSSRVGSQEVEPAGIGLGSWCIEERTRPNRSWSRLPWSHTRVVLAQASVRSSAASPASDMQSRGPLRVVPDLASRRVAISQRTTSTRTERVDLACDPRIAPARILARRSTSSRISPPNGGRSIPPAYVQRRVDVDETVPLRTARPPTARCASASVSPRPLFRRPPVSTIGGGSSANALLLDPVRLNTWVDCELYHTNLLRIGRKHEGAARSIKLLADCPAGHLSLPQILKRDVPAQVVARHKRILPGSG